jgi:hypothetical protein
LESEDSQARVTTSSEVVKFRMDSEHPVSVLVFSESVNTDSSVKIPDLNCLIFGVTDYAILLKSKIFEIFTNLSWKTTLLTLLV